MAKKNDFFGYYSNFKVLKTLLVYISPDWGGILFGFLKKTQKDKADSGTGVVMERFGVLQKKKKIKVFDWFLGQKIWKHFVIFAF